MSSSELCVRSRPRQNTLPVPSPRQITRPALFIALSLLIAIGTMVLFATLLFEQLSFRHSWDADDLHYNPGSQAELDHRFPPGTRIPVYLFPDMKGRDRVQVYEGLPPAEASQRMAIKELRYSLMILAGTGGRSWC